MGSHRRVLNRGYCDLRKRIPLPDGSVNILPSRLCADQSSSASTQKARMAAGNQFTSAAPPPTVARGILLKHKSGPVPSFPQTVLFLLCDWSQGLVYHRQMLCHCATAPTLSENLHAFLSKVYACFTAIEIVLSICSRCWDKITKIGQFINNRCLFRWQFWRLGVGYCRISYHIITRQKASRGQKEQVYSEWMRDREMRGRKGTKAIFLVRSSVLWQTNFLPRLQH